MAGHSKWAQIKRKKAVTDSRRGQLWTRILKEVGVAARIGGGDPSGNARLRSAIQEAKDKNVPSDNIDRAIKRGTGELEGVSYEEFTYEGYGPGGVAILVETVTDNKNRTVSEIRHLFSKHGGNLGATGCVGWMFDKRGYIAIEKSTLNEEQFMELALDAGAEDISTEEDTYEIYTTPDSFLSVLAKIEASAIPTVSSELAMIAQNYVDLEPELCPKVLRLIEALEDNEDVQSVWSNFNLDEDLLQEQPGA
jgi:YebC/PmpR family DNA-binding regulatory protein